MSDIVVTRRNDRRLRLDADRYVRNGDRWSVTAVHPDGSLDVAALPRPGSEGPGAGAFLRLPAEYAREHVELGYAATIHRAQGMTVDRAHVLTGPGMTRQALYVAMTRGRDANHAYTPTDGPSPDCPDPHGSSEPTGRQILEQGLATDGAAVSATATMRQRQNEATSPARLRAIRDTLATFSNPDAAHSATEIDQILRALLAAARTDDRRPRSVASPPVSHRDGISR